MTRNRWIFLAVSGLVVLPLLTGTLLAANQKEVDDGDSMFKYLTVFTEVLTRIRENYVDSPDMEQLLAGALDGTTDALDPFSLYVPASATGTYESVRSVGTRHSGLLLLKENGILYVAGVTPGSPAERGGVKLGDVVAEIAGENTRVMPLFRAQQWMAGSAGTVLALKVNRLGEMKSLSLTLGPYIPETPVLYAVQGVGVVAIPTFDANTLAAVETALAEAKKANYDKLVVDLRGSWGGDPTVGFAVAGLFASGEIGSLSSRGQSTAAFKGRDALLYQGKIAVLTDRGTLGASEAVAAVLRQKAAARVVGARTFGYCGQQQAVKLTAGGTLFFTDAFCAGPDGKTIRASQLPDERVEEDFFAPEGEESAKDEALERALTWLLGNEAAPAKAA